MTRILYLALVASSFLSVVAFVDDKGANRYRRSDFTELNTIETDLVDDASKLDDELIKLSPENLRESKAAALMEQPYEEEEMESKKEVTDASSPINEIVMNVPPTASGSSFPNEGQPSVATGTSWLALFLLNGRGLVWTTVNLILLVLTVLVALFSLYRLVGLRSCTFLVPRTLYLLILLLCFFAAAITSVHLSHWVFGGVEGLPLFLTLLLTHTPTPCITAAVVMVLHRNLMAARLPWPVTSQTLGIVSTVLILSSVVGDIIVAALHNTPLLITIRVTLTALALLPLLLFMLRFAKIVEVSKVLNREFNGELKLMVPAPREEQEQNAVRTLLRDILKSWATLLLFACMFSIVMWTCNLSISVFFTVSKVPIWMWWVFHIINCLSQITVIVLLIIACVITQSNHQNQNILSRMFLIPSDALVTPSAPVTDRRSFVYERVSYSSGQESSQRTSSSQNDTDETEVRTAPGGNNDPNYNRPRVTLQRSATFNCAPRGPAPYYGPMYSNYGGYPPLLPPDNRVGSYSHIPGHYGPIRMPMNQPPLLQDESGFVRMNISPSGPYHIQPDPSQQQMFMLPHNQHQMMLANPSVDIEYNSLRRFPRHHQNRYLPSNQGGGDYGHAGGSKMGPYGVMRHQPQTISRTQSPLVQSPATTPVSPYHALHLPISSANLYNSQGIPYSVPNNEGRPLPSIPALPSRGGSFRNHYSPVSPTHQPSFTTSPTHQPSFTTSPLSSPHANSPTTVKSIGFPPPPPTSPVPVEEPNGDVNGPINEKKEKLYGSAPPIVPSRNGSVLSIPQNQAELQIHQSEKSLENTVRDILLNSNKPVIKSNRRPLESNGRFSRHRPVYPYNGHGSYGNFNGQMFADDIRNVRPDMNGSHSFIPMNDINSIDHALTDDEGLSDRNPGSGLRRNHSTAGCYRPRNDIKDSYCQTDDEDLSNSKYSSFRRRDMQQKPSSWYGTWAGRKKPKNGAYSIDPSADNKDRAVDKKLSASRASLLSLYSKLKSRKDSKGVKTDSGGDSTEKDEVSQASEEMTPTPSEGTSIAPSQEEEESTLEDALDEILEPKEPNADWTMDILSSSSVLSDFYKLKEKPDRPPPLPELSEVDA